MKTNLDSVAKDWKLSPYRKIKRFCSISLKKKKYLKEIEENLKSQLPYKPDKKQIKWCYKDFRRYAVLYNAQLNVDYFEAGIYRKSGFVRQESFANRKRFVWRDSVQEKSKWDIFQDKRRFYDVYEKFLGRDYICVDDSLSYEKFSDFIRSHGSDVFAKIPIGCGGKEVFHWNIKTDEDMKKKYNEALKNGMLVEERLTQTKDIAEFSPSSINTMRIITVVDDNGKVRIANALFRIGNGDCIDNFCSGGMITKIDVDTGVVFLPAIDKNGRQYILHPVSKKQIVGYKIPDWNKYVDFAVEMAKHCPSMRYVGWDIVMKSDGTMCCIEGNKDAGVNLQEMPVSYGLIPLYEALLKGNEELDYSYYGSSSKSY